MQWNYDTVSLAHLSGVCDDDEPRSSEECLGAEWCLYGGMAAPRTSEFPLVPQSREGEG
jgi:hypothetical protein